MGKNHASQYANFGSLQTGAKIRIIEFGYTPLGRKNETVYYLHSVCRKVIEHQSIRIVTTLTEFIKKTLEYVIR